MCRGRTKIYSLTVTSETMFAVGVLLIPYSAGAWLKLEDVSEIGILVLE